MVLDRRKVSIERALCPGLPALASYEKKQSRCPLKKPNCKLQLADRFCEADRFGYLPCE